MCKHCCALKRYAFRDGKKILFANVKNIHFVHLTNMLHINIKIVILYMWKTHFEVEKNIRYVQRFLNLKSKITLSVHVKRYIFCNSKNFIYFTYATSIFFCVCEKFITFEISILSMHEHDYCTCNQNDKSYSIYYIES